MKPLGLGGGLQARGEPAQEPGCGGDTGDSAAMNMWLHNQVTRKLLENGGKVPDEMRAQAAASSAAARPCLRTGVPRSVDDGLPRRRAM